MPLADDFKGMITEQLKKSTIVNNWESQVFGDIQRLSNPQKGVLGEEFTCKLLCEAGLDLVGNVGYVRHNVSKTVESNTDIRFRENGNEKKLEVKLATMDTSKSYQFNWININYNFDYIFFLAIGFDGINGCILNKHDIQTMQRTKKPYALTKVPPENPNQLKWTASRVAIKTLFTPLITQEDFNTILRRKVNTPEITG